MSHQILITDVLTNTQAQKSMKKRNVLLSLAIALSLLCFLNTTKADLVEFNHGYKDKNHGDIPLICPIAIEKSRVLAVMQVASVGDNALVTPNCSVFTADNPPKGLKTDLLNQCFILVASGNNIIAFSVKESESEILKRLNEGVSTGKAPRLTTLSRSSN
jgi:hypothetical protein